MPPDVLARTRASDWRLLALLAAKNGRMDEALDLAERSLRYRNRLYGCQSPADPGGSWHARLGAAVAG
ncbi:hypothetical protein [Candidatus Aalborgicola defluviihabitans]|uniref:hypothetical protein n=1 Tax=Candidatus Aalborgicola defluviihabitans TaxID=3386187 RepID=UPI001ED1473B|nr:hypothetical protein [Burkholderiales bacterium]